jgi:anti-sigma factor RsiW
MMMCKEVMQLMPLYAGSDLQPAQQDEVALHLAHCLSCYREHRHYGEAMDALARVRQASSVLPVPLDALPEEVLHHVHGEEVVPLGDASHSTHWAFLVPVAAAAAILVLMVGTSLLTPRGRPSPAPAVFAAPVVQPMSEDVGPQMEGSAVNFQPRRIWDGRRIVNRSVGARDF